MGHNRNLADYAHHFDGTHIDLGSGNIETQGVLTYEDVTNVDAIGIVTARAGVKVPDNQKIFLGTDDDLRIFHDGSQNVINSYTINPLNIVSNGDTTIKTNNNDNMAVFKKDNAVELYYDNSLKLSTASGGVNIAGNLNLNSADNYEIRLGAGNDLKIYHNATNSYIQNNTGVLFLRSDGGTRIQDTGGNEMHLKTIDNGAVELYYDNSKKLETTSTGATVTGTLVSDSVTSELDLSAISSSITRTATDVFVYDTRKDSDGGAWRKRTQHTSWYNETLNTSTRGSRREFPAVAVIVAEQNFIRIYDGDDPDLPMWMVFNTIADGVSQGMADRPMVQVQNTDKIVYALNGILATGTRNEGSNYGQPVINFINEVVLRMDSQGGEGGRWLGNIAQRNEAIGYQSVDYDYVIAASRVNDIVMKVLPNAPIDDTTGLPVPTIFVATDGGLSIIKEDGTVIDGTSASGSAYSYTRRVTITDENYLWWLGDSYNGYNSFRDSYALSLDTLPSSNFTWNNSTDNLSTGKFYALTTGNEGGEIKIGSVNTWAWTLQERNAIGGGSGFAIHKPNIGSETNSLFALITSDYNSGYLPGDCRGAFLADTDTTNKTNGQTDPDRSKYNYALSVTGTINKSVVATGADLVGYHGFTSSNYLRHTNGINYGNAATITMGGWSKIPGSAVDSNYRYLCSVKSGGEVLGLAIHIDNGSYGGKPYFYDVTNSSLQSDGPRVDDNKWHHILGVFDGTSKKIYIDGELIASATVTGINLSSVNITNVGHYVPGNNNTPNYNHEGYLALIKFSASAATAEQVKKMYEEEKVLFQENAKCTLYGSSNAVTGLAYDDSTELYHVGTSAGRSDFQGLRRINNTTTAVTTAISASDELIAEQ